VQPGAFRLICLARKILLFTAYKLATLHCVLPEEGENCIVLFCRLFREILISEINCGFFIAGLATFTQAKIKRGRERTEKSESWTLQLQVS
jgi:hypothetical protein